MRTIPLPRVVVDALAAHLAAYPPGPDGLVFTLRGEPITRQRHGKSVKTVQARLGHKSAVETLDTHAHLRPDSGDRTREAIDAVLGNPAADSVRTGAAST